MTMISYAQNFEDVILNRIFNDIKQGFYIDVGANDPVIDSVTKHFYDSGWTGINIEPVAEHFQALQIQRPNDINLQVAISLEEGKLEFWESEVRGWSTASPERIALHKQQNEKGTINQVESSTLTKVCEQYAKDDIHFLKVDVEGFEKAVIESNDWSRFRPWVVVVEATLPNSQIESFAEWESILLEADYQFTYADGLNRFYLAKEHDYLSERLRYPPNVFDQFSMFSLHVKNTEVDDLVRQNQNLAAQIANYEEREKNIVTEHEFCLAKINEQHCNTLKQLETSYSTKVNNVQKECLEQQKQSQLRVQTLESNIKMLSFQYQQSQDLLETEKTTNTLLRRELVNVKYQTLINEQLKGELDYTRLELAQIHRMNHLAHLQIQELTLKLSMNESKMRQMQSLQIQLERTQAALICLENSRSWKITRPLRKLKAILTENWFGR